MTQYAIGDRVEIFTEGFPVPANYRGTVTVVPDAKSIVMWVHCDDEQDRLFILEDTRKQGGPVDGEFRVLFQTKAGDEWRPMRPVLPTRALAEEFLKRQKAKWRYYDTRIEGPTP